MDVPPGFDEDAEIVSPDDELVSGPADPMESAAALLVDDLEEKVIEFKEKIGEFKKKISELNENGCQVDGLELWESRERKIRFDLEEWLSARRIAEARQNTGRAATESGIFTSDMRALQVAVSGGQFKIDGRDDPLKSNHVHAERTKQNARRKHPERRSEVYKLTDRAWGESKEWLKTLLLVRALEQKDNCDCDLENVFKRSFRTSIEAEMKRKANCMEPSERERLLKLYDNRDFSGWFNEQIWPRIEETGEKAIFKEYPDAIERAKSVQNETPGASEGASDRSLMGALRRACRDEFVKVIGPAEFWNNT